MGLIRYMVVSAMRRLQAYPSLPTPLCRIHPPQQADLIRYMIVLRYGGFYADLDVGCVGDNNLGDTRHNPNLNPNLILP